MSQTRTVRVSLSLVLIVVLGLAAFEYEFGYVTGYRVPGFPMVRSPSLLLDLQQLAGLREFHSQLGQDKWIIGKVFAGVQDGYFVDIGSWDAVTFSNSKSLEDLGWTGVCVDPFPQNWRDRSCQLFEEVLHSRAGEIVEFRQAGGLGGIDEHIDRWKDAVKEEPVVSLTTTTIADVLERAAAPRFIHYVSLDTEGAEYEILKAFPFEEYTVGAFTIEHNFEKVKRARIRKLLESNGYRFVRNQLVEDWYVRDTRD